jgi:hypothetical protein
MDLGDISFKCAVCGIAINEIEGMIMENATVTEIENYLKNDVCSVMEGYLKVACEMLASQVETIIDKLENRWTVSVVCIDLGFCDKPFTNHTDPVEIPSYNINLDLEPEDRWKEVCSHPPYQKLAQFLYKTITAILPGHGKELEKVGEIFNMYFPKELQREVKGCSQHIGVPYGWLSLFNLGYELSDACTSIIAEDKDGKILHARNLDFWAGMGFTDTLKEMAFTANMQKKRKDNL